MIKSAPQDEVVDAVIISGPRRGEIIHLNAANEEEWTEEECAAILTALKEADAAILAARAEVRALNQSLREGLKA